MFKPLNKRVLVKPNKRENETDFGILIESKQEDRPVTGVVVVGNEMVKKDDKVLFSRYGFDEVTIGKESFYVVSESSLLGIFD